MREAAAPRIARGAGLNHSIKFSRRPPPKPSCVKTAPLPFLGIFTGLSARKSRRLDKKPGERGFCAAPRRGADPPAGSVTLGGGVPGSLHLCTSVLNHTCLESAAKSYPTLTIQPKHEWMPTGARLTCQRIHCNITALPEEDGFQFEW